MDSIILFIRKQVNNKIVIIVGGDNYGNISMCNISSFYNILNVRFNYARQIK